MINVSIPICFSKKDCQVKLSYIDSKIKSFDSTYQFIIPVKPINKSFAFSTDHNVTANLLSRVWNVTSVSELTKDPRLLVEHKKGYHGRYLDFVQSFQLLSNSNYYMPFTIVKQALRWEYACQCYGTSFLPFHSVVIKLHGKYIGFSGYGKAGKSYIADSILKEYPDSVIVIDDWSLIDIKTKIIYHVGDNYLHVRGSTLDKKSFQLTDGITELVELCDNDMCSEETRFLIKRSDLPFFYHGQEELRLDAIIFIRNPFSEQVIISTNTNEVDALLESEANHFWDDSNIDLPNEIFKEMFDKWCYLLSGLKILILDGHRRTNLSFIVKKLLTLI